ncbi:hypothetical protein V4T45_000119 [Vibrio vulnificus]|nr:hypothetical protein [Vibrio vulnificus]ELR8768890.1 hypothetical protein [Vibrio vulnificus]
MPRNYKTKIVKAFRDNAIKSVLLIDDEYLPYEGVAGKYMALVQGLKPLSAPVDEVGIAKTKLADILNLVGQFENAYLESDRSKKFVEFFHCKQLLCDVEDDTENLDKNKIRKSDLIMLDYHLTKIGPERERAKKSLQLINELSASKHMNVVVVYTAEPLPNVWFEIATSLRGSHMDEFDTFVTDADLIREWELNSQDWLSEWESIAERSIDAAYLCDNHDIETLHTELVGLCDEKGFSQPSKEHVEWMLERVLKRHNLNATQTTNLKVHGTSSLWIQAGDVFVVLCSKEVAGEGNVSRDTTPIEVWDLIETALIDWYPSFYRVVISELQNQIEDANLSMEKVLARGTVEQIAALWGLLRVSSVERKNSAKVLLESLLSDVVDKIQSESELLDFVSDAAEDIASELPNYVSPVGDARAKQAHAEYLKRGVEVAGKNLRHEVGANDTDFRCSVVHALNEQLSVEKELPNYISTGVVLKDTVEGSYYLCIAPSCNTVPNQKTGGVAKSMTPHRPMRFIKLSDYTDKLADKLKDAHQSDVIFVSDGDTRLALGVYERGGDGPIIEQGVVIHHDTKLIEGNKAKKVQFLVTNRETQLLEVKNKMFELVAKLRPEFASRYQNIQIQYESRIGVDLVSANMK